ncbi:MAG: T9SS type A sorting domain-containing protein [Candidatus Marinimicrobia bacterium]|nr:T9SS type A sorting domain-containing protein [Candidatus Neomarinimicrobiota bacterium]MCF7840354.1 T9SS type A sorting domain-containing protein [Candidatus Neomarinimicrobiota bacterium]MCF7902967.1 T9SS type A sorting domain-containing protein [Candidatus Neomarinimicrobiota bacterium]
MTNQGDADFTALIFGNTNTRDLAFGNLNNDDAIDLATDHYTFLNTGNGYNANLPHSILNNGYPVKDVALGDFNGDGYDDLLYLVPSPSNTLKLWRNVNGNFPNLTWSKAFDAGLNLAIDFFNTGYLPPKEGQEDKYEDIIVSNYSTGEIYVFVSTGDELTPYPSQPSQTITVSNLSDVYCADIDGDGYNELLASNSEYGTTTDHVFIFWNIDGSYDLTNPVNIHSTESGTYKLVVEDINYDGKPDLVLGDMEGLLAIHYNLGTGYYFNQTPDIFSVENVAFYDYLNDLVVADLNGLGGKSVLMSFDDSGSGAGIYEFSPTTVNAVPSPPQYLVINGEVGGHPRPSWKHQKESDFQEYEVWRGFGGGTPYSQIATVTDEFFEDTQFDIVDRSAYGVKVKPPEGGTITNLIYYVKTVDHTNQVSLESNHAYTYTLLPGGIYKSTAKGDQVSITEFGLADPYPNPFNPSVTIPFGIPENGTVTFEIYDILGRLVYSISSQFTAGTHSFVWQGVDSRGNKVASGVYIAKVVSGTQTKLVRLAFTK